MAKYLKKLSLNPKLLAFLSCFFISHSAVAIEPLGDFPGFALHITGKDYVQLEAMYGTLQCHNMQCMTVGGSVGYLPFAHEWSINGQLSLQVLLMIHMLWSPGVLLDHQNFEVQGLQNWLGLGAGSLLALARQRYDFEKRQSRWEFGVGIRYFFIN